MKNTPLLLAALIGGLFSAGCVTHIKTDITQNPPPSEKFAAFNHFEMAKIALPEPYAGQAANQKALAKIQENVSAKMDLVLKSWNDGGAKAAPVRTLVIEPAVAEIKFINATSRVWGGAFAGSSAVILRARISDKETGQVIATPEFYARAAAMGGAWSMGATDNVMLVRIANRLTDYLSANYAAAVGGPTGAEPPEKK